MAMDENLEHLHGLLMRAGQHEQRAGAGVNGKMAGNPAKQPIAVCMAQCGIRFQEIVITAKIIATYTLCLDFRHFYKAGRSIVRA